MKKLFTFLLSFSLLTYNISYSQDESVDTNIGQEDTSYSIVDTIVDEATIQVVEEEIVEEEVVEESQSFHYAIKEQFIQGGWQFMGIVLLCLILGLAVAIERIITLNLRSEEHTF